MRIQIALAAVLVAGAFVPGCGCNRSGQLPAPPKGAKEAAWAKEDFKVTPATGKASFVVNFEDMNGAIVAASEIYMNVKDAYGRSAFNTTVPADKNGAVKFEDVPVGNYMLDFMDQLGRRTHLRIDLGKFTGDGAGKNAGTVQF